MLLFQSFRLIRRLIGRRAKKHFVASATEAFCFGAREHKASVPDANFDQKTSSTHKAFRRNAMGNLQSAVISSSQFSSRSNCFRRATNLCPLLNCLFLSF